MITSSAVSKNLFPILGLLLGAGFLLSSCVTVATDQDIMSLNDQVVLLNNRVNTLQDAMNKREASLQDTMSKREASLSKELSGGVDARLTAIRGNLAEVVADTDRIKQDLDTLSGKVEENSHLAKHAVERDTTQEDMLRAEIADMQGRIGKLEKSVTDLKAYLGLQAGFAQRESAKTGEGKSAPAPPVSPEKAKYDNSLAVYKQGKLEEAIVDFKDFLKTYPQSDLADNAQYWIGECYMGLNQYEQAILAFQQVIKRYPNGNKVPNAMFRQALAFEAIKDTTSAKLLLTKIIKNYPKSNEASIAKTKLESLK
jgi:tol-pal system protein YbgF